MIPTGLIGFATIMPIFLSQWIVTIPLKHFLHQGNANPTITSLGRRLMSIPERFLIL